MTALAAMSVLAFSAAPAAAAVFSFETDPLGQATPFSSSSTALTASFAGPSATDPGAFQISYNSTSGPLPLYSNLQGAFLGTALDSLDPLSPLLITFSQPIAAISLDFALGGRTGALNLSTDAGGSAQAVGAVPGGFNYVEGSLRFSGAPFTSVTLSTDAISLAVDNIVASDGAAAVPEPATVLLLGAGLAGASGLRRRRRA